MDIIGNNPIHGPPPFGLLPARFQDPREIPTLVQRFVQELNADDLTAWIHRLLAGSMNEEEFFAHLSNKNQSSVCAYSFRAGEPAYQCSTCGVDPTCIQCSSCFRLANHIGHDVKMTHAGGGGICDCGDSSSWSSQGFCSEHKGHGEVDSVDLSWLPAHAIVTFQSLLECAIKSILQLDAHYVIDNEIFGDSVNHQRTHVGFLHNDDVHSFNDIISLLHSIARLPERVGLNIALKVDYYQRAVFVVGSESLCRAFVLAFRVYEVSGVVEPLSEVLLTEERVVEILGLLTELCSKSDAFRRLACDVLTRHRGDAVFHGSYMSALMHASSILSSIVSSAMAPFHFQLFVSISFKEAFTIEFTRHYGVLVRAMTRPSHSHSRSVLDYSVQLYTIPDMVLRLCRSQNLLGIFLDVFQGLVRAQLSMQPVRADDQDENLVINGLRDLAYIVTNQGVCRYVYESRPDIIKIWLDILLLADGLDSQIRQTGVHVDYESINWWFAFRMMLRLQPVSRIFLEEFSKYFVSQDSERIAAPMIASLSDSLTENGIALQMVNVGNGFQCPEYDITRQPVSMHFPLRRFVMEFTTRFALATSCLFTSIFQSSPIFIGLVDSLLRSVAFIGHIRGGLWVLNGNMLVQQAATYERIQARDCMFDPDLIALQCSAVVMGPVPFLSMLSYRFLLHEIFFPGQIACASFDDSIDRRKISAIIEYFIHLLIGIIVERSRITDDKLWGLRRDIVHWLMTGDLTHSDLLYRLGMESPSAELQQLLPEVSRFVTPREMESGKYQVRKAAAAEMFDPLFIKYSDLQRETAIAAFASQGHRSVVLPTLPLYSAPFRSLFVLSASSKLFQILHTVLNSAELTSPRLVLMCLRLIGSGLRDAQVYPFEFPVDEYVRNISFKFGSHVSVFEMLCHFVRNDVEKARGHVDYVRLLIDGVSSLSAQCSQLARTLLSGDFAAQQQHGLALKAEERRRRREAARAAALGAIQTQIEQFSASHVDSLQAVARVDDADDGSLHVCILCRSSESQNDLGLLTWMGRYEFSDLLQPSDSRCRHRLQASPFTYTRDCGHAMHLECYNGYMQSLTAKKSAREHYEGQYVIDLSKGEFICPLCKSHANTLLPILSPITFDSNGAFNEASDTVTWIATSLPAICRQLEQESQNQSSSEPENNCINVFNGRIVEGFPDGSIVQLLAHNIAIIEVQLRDGHTLSDRQMMHLRFLIATASQELRGRAASLVRSFLPLNIAATSSLEFIIECCLCLLLLENPFQSVLRLIRIGFTTLCSNIDDGGFDENQYGHAASLAADSSRHELFTLPYLRQIVILLSALSPNFHVPDMNSYSDLRQCLHLLNVESGLRKLVQGSKVSLPLAYVRPTLAVLPPSFMELFDASTRVSCLNCGKVPARPAVCLICGDMLCSSKDCGNGYGGLTVHTANYLGDQGLYLSINQDCVFLICNGFSCEFSPPYLDEHGEDDIGLHRGNPLFLDADRYEMLRQLVVRLEIGSSVSRKRSYQSSIVPRNAI